MTTESSQLLDELALARERVATAFGPTPLVNHPLIDQELGCRAFVKLENTTPVGAFKLRGAMNLVAGLDEAARAQGLCAPTRGNHGQGLAWAAQRAGIPCTLFVPEGNSSAKNTAMRAFGAEVKVAGFDFDETVKASADFAMRCGARDVHPGRERALVLGAATLFLEMFEQAEQALEALFVPVGVGSCLAGAVLATRALGVSVHLVGVQASAAPAMAHAIQRGGVRSYSVKPTLADGLAVGEPIPQTLALLRGHVDDMVLVEERELREAMRLYATTLNQLAEGAGAASLAGALQRRADLRGRRVGLVLSGGNIDTSTLKELLQ